MDEFSVPMDLTRRRFMHTQVDVSSDDEPLVRPISGRHVFPRVPHDRDGAADDQEPTNTECGATVPASPGALIVANRFSNWPPSRNQNLRLKKFTCHEDAFRGWCCYHRTSQ